MGWLAFSWKEGWFVQTSKLCQLSLHPVLSPGTLPIHLCFSLDPVSPYLECSMHTNPGETPLCFLCLAGGDGRMFCRSKLWLMHVCGLLCNIRGDVCARTQW